MEESVIFGEATDNQVDAGLEEVDFAAALLGEEQQQEAPAETAIEEQGVGDPAQESQKDVGKAFAAESRRLEAKYRKEFEAKMAADPVRVMGMRVLEEVMRTQNVPMEQAMKIAEENYYNAIAERENVSPAIARAVFSRQPQQPQEQDVYARAAEIHRDLADIDLPDGFSFETAIKDQQFAQMLLDMPTEAAIRVYHAERRASEAQQDVAERLRARQSLPQAMKPQQPVTPKRNFMEMSDEEFLEFDRNFKP